MDTFESLREKLHKTMIKDKYKFLFDKENPVFVERLSLENNGMMKILRFYLSFNSPSSKKVSLDKITFYIDWYFKLEPTSDIDTTCTIYTNKYSLAMESLQATQSDDDIGELIMNCAITEVMKKFYIFIYGLGNSPANKNNFSTDDQCRQTGLTTRSPIESDDWEKIHIWSETFIEGTILFFTDLGFSPASFSKTIDSDSDSDMDIDEIDFSNGLDLDIYGVDDSDIDSN